MPDTEMLGFSEVVDRLVPLFAKLLATLAAEDPVRMSFADVGERTLFEIAQLLKHKHGLTNQLVATTLGLTRAGFLAKERRFHQRYGDGFDQAPPRTLEVYECILEWPDPAGPGQDELEAFFLERFQEGPVDRRKSTGETALEEVRAVLRYLEKEKVIRGTGAKGPGRRYVCDRELREPNAKETLSVYLYRSKTAQTVAQIEEGLGWSRKSTLRALDELRQDSSLLESPGPDGTTLFRVEHYHLSYGTRPDYPVVLLDHLQAVIESVCYKISQKHFKADLADLTGGTTYTFILPDGDPFTDEVSAFLRETRERMDRWMARADDEFSPLDPAQSYHQITVYVGQSVRPHEPKGAAEEA